MKIAILQCLNISAHCTGFGCLKAYNSGDKHFAQYGDDRPALLAFFLCNGCSTDHATDEGWLRKLNRLRDEGVDKIHVGVCVDEKCAQRETLLSQMTHFGFLVEEGTH